MEKGDEVNLESIEMINGIGCHGLSPMVAECRYDLKESRRYLNNNNNNYYYYYYLE